MLLFFFNFWIINPYVFFFQIDFQLQIFIRVAIFTYEQVFVYVAVNFYSESVDDSIKGADKFLLGLTPSSRTFSAERIRLPLPDFSLLKASW